MILMTVTQVVTVAVIKQRRQLPKLALMVSLVTLQAQAGLVSPDQEEWLWRDVPVIHHDASSGQAQSHEREHESSGSGVGSALMWYWLGHMSGSSGGGGNAGGNNYAPSSQPARPNPNTSHWYSNGSGGNSSSDSGASKGYSSGGFGSSASRSGYSAGSSGG